MKELFMKTAIVLGSTGLVGKEIVKQLLEDESWDKIKTFNRRPLGIENSRLNEHLVDFELLDSWKHELSGTTLFSALGTTKEQAGSIRSQRKVDYHYQYEVAKAARIHGVENMVLVSAPFAHPFSPIPYTKMKGELERDLMKLGFVKLTIIRPGPLYGEREHQRPSEEKTIRLLRKLPEIPGLEVLRPISGWHVAHSCIKAANDGRLGVEILSPKDVLRL
jgi:uncharacterized protein YbjT (DUF2867 family)